MAGARVMAAYAALAAVMMVPFASLLGWWIVPAGVALYLVSDVLHQLGHFAGALMTGVPRSRMHWRYGHASVSRLITPRQDLVTWLSGPLVSLVVMVAAAATRTPFGWAVVATNAVILCGTLASDCAGNTDGARIAEHVRTWREKRRLSPLAAEVAKLEGVGRFDQAVALAVPRVRKDPLNYQLAVYVATRLAQALRPAEAAGVMRRYAAQYEVPETRKARARLVWCDLVLTYADVLTDDVEEALRVVDTTNTGDDLVAAYLNGIAALRRGDHAKALADADRALEWWQAGEPTSAHVLGCVHGIRALALQAVGREDDAREALRTGLEFDANCAIPDVIDEAKAALAA